MTRSKRWRRQPVGERSPPPRVGIALEAVPERLEDRGQRDPADPVDLAPDRLGVDAGLGCRQEVFDLLTEPLARRAEAPLAGLDLLGEALLVEASDAPMPIVEF